MFGLVEPPEDERFKYESLAFNYRESLRKMMADHGVRDAVNQALANATCDEADAILTLEELLLNACLWFQLSRSTRQKSVGVPRSEIKRDLNDVQRKCLSLINQLKQLKSVIRDGLSLEYLVGRIESDNPKDHFLDRKQWRPTPKWNRKPTMIDALEALAQDLTDEIDWISGEIKARRQGTSRQSRNHVLMDQLMRLSTRLGKKGMTGEKVPDFGLVFSIMSHMDPATSLDQSTLQKRWTKR